MPVTRGTYHHVDIGHVLSDDAEGMVELPWILD
ncbi:uncharacterized protein METZ01_LOCUS260681, partial [marine metagenome]